jgi:hypothetical protein
MAAGWQARLPLFEIACVLARFDHIASSIVSANHGVTSQQVYFFVLFDHLDTAASLAIAPVCQRRICFGLGCAL